ncbi:hypothetical protein B0J17DRAFT_633945 [Rhizoctonia solani]|nr:hypothetical protein B0J17DRAFT_633945 [Rhizoctonia solani]
MLWSTLARLLTFALVLTLGVVVQSVPIGANKGLAARGTCTDVCTTGIQTLKNLADLDAKLQPEYKSLDDKYNHGDDPSANFVNIIALFMDSITRLETVDKDQTGQLKGKAEEIYVLSRSISADLAPGGREFVDHLCNVFNCPAIGPVGPIGGGVGNGLHPIKNIASAIANAVLNRVDASPALGSIPQTFHNLKDSHLGIDS